jgi:hypothetical protein
MGQTNIDKSKENPNAFIISPEEDGTHWFTTELVFGDVYFLFGSFGYRFSVNLRANIMAARLMKSRV